MVVELSQRFYFEAAHTLRRAPEKGSGLRESSLRIHGHTYHAEVTLRGEPSSDTGMLVDLAVLRAALGEVSDALDHRFLDEVAGLGPATLENLCQFIWRALAPQLPQLARVTVERQASGDKCSLCAS
jgi:6-pyruvoyltetrahydropterin/6-carboxytetrahydropterin synthase